MNDKQRKLVVLGKKYIYRQVSGGNMKKVKYYVVIRGRIKGILLSWEDCKNSVKAYPNSKYKAFDKANDAINFLVNEIDIVNSIEFNEDLNETIEDSNKVCIEDCKPRKNISADSEYNLYNDKKTEDKSDTTNQYIEKNWEDFDTIEAYIDGSYEHSSKTYGSGVVILGNGQVLDSISNTGNNSNYVSMRNVAGEIEASMLAIKYCINAGIKNIIIYYDYDGIEKWCTGEWKTNKEGTIYYRQFYNEAIKKINIKFVKVKAHSGNKYNDMADKLAKQAVFN